MSKVIGHVKPREKITGSASGKKIYPELENLSVKPTNQVQNFKSDKYGYENVTVFPVEGDTINIVPSFEKQTHTGLFDTVNVDGIQSDDLIIKPTLESQTYKGLYDEVTVKGIESDTLTIDPTLEKQTYSGLYDTVNVNAIDSQEISINPTEETQTREGLYNKVTVGKVETEEKSAILNFSDTDTIEITPTEGKYIKKVSINKDEKLVSENIVKDVEIDGVVGSYEGLSTKDATATESDILATKTAYNANGKVTGTIPNNGALNYTPSNADQVIPEGYTTGGIVAGDSDLLPENIKKDVEIFGVVGEMEQLDTSDATATVEDIATGKTAYVNGEKLEGVAELKGEENAIIDDGLVPVNTESSNNYAILKMITKLPSINTIGWTSTHHMFYYCSNLKEIPELDTSNVFTMDDMFSYCSSLTTIPELDTSRVTSMSNLFYNCSSLTTIPELDTSNVTNMGGLFYGCSNLQEVPELNTSNVTNMAGLFYGCSNLQEVPELNTSNVIYTYSMFEDCSSLTTIPQIDTSNVTNAGIMFRNCSNLKTIPLIDFGNVKRITNIVTNCTNLTNLSGFKDLGKAYTQKTKNYTNYKLDLSTCTNLTHDSLMNVINNLYNLYEVYGSGTTYTQSLTLGSTNKAKLTSSEIAIATNKGWTVS